MSHSIKHFFAKEFSKDALRNILVILTPAVALYYTIGIDTAIAFAVGVVLSSLTDLPGNRQDKKLTTMWCTPLFTIAAWSTSMALHHVSWGIIPILATFGFFCTLLIAFGPRWGVIGNLTLIVISFTIGLKPHNPLLFATAFTSGTLVFFTVSLIQVYLSPYRSLKFAMKEGFELMAILLETKIKCYDEKAPLDQVYKELSLLHIKISEQLEIIRSLLLREKNLVSSCQDKDLIWLNKIYRLIDLYELLMGIDTDYETIREQLNNNETLPIIRHILLLLSEEIKELETTKPQSNQTRINSIHKNTLKLKKIQKGQQIENRFVISPILEHIEHIVRIVQEIQTATVSPDATWINASAYKNFVPSHTSLEVVLNHIKGKSAIYIYALRMAALLALSGMIGYLLPEYRYASWIILTVILVARPSYANTQRRNYQRIVGSLIGIALSLIITLTIHNPFTLLFIAAISLYGFFLFNKPDYLVCVIFITVTIIISLHLYEGNIWDLLGSRIAFTLLGSAFAVLGCLTLPVNHRKAVKNISDTLIDNYNNYYQKLRIRLYENTVDYQELRLVRKHAQTSLAQLYDHLDQFRKEPRLKKQDWSDIISFQTLAYRINALLVGISVSITKSSATTSDNTVHQRLENIETLIRHLDNLGQSAKFSNKR